MCKSCAAHRSLISCATCSVPHDTKGQLTYSVWQSLNRIYLLPWERKIPGLNPDCAGIFSGSSHSSDSKIGTPVATLPGAWRYRVSAGTGRPGVSILWLGEVESLICNFSVWQHVKLSEQICPCDTLACCWDIKQPTNKQILFIGWNR